MANTRAQAEVEAWITRYWMPLQFGQSFRKQRMGLSAGGQFEFDAVSADDLIVASISTSCGTTSGGKYPVGKVHKLRADILFLTMIAAARRLLVLTDPAMHGICVKEAQRGRLPVGIEFFLADIPNELALRCKLAQEHCSREVRPLSRTE